MKFPFQFFREMGGLRAVEPDLFPVVLDLPTAQEARSIVQYMAAARDSIFHSLTIYSEDGGIAERWFQLNGSSDGKGFRDVTRAACLAANRALAVGEDIGHPG